ncbi:MAG: DUF4129 domain-containing protein [Allosphingosinicella sp.]
MKRAEAIIGGEAVQAAGAARDVAAAHRALIADPDIQFALQPASPPPRPPEWLLDVARALGRLFRPVGRAIEWVGSFFPDAPYALILLWTVIGLAGAALIYGASQRLGHGTWPMPWRRRRRAGSEAAEEEGWAPEEAPARAWLEEADALARQGRYAEAVRHLLYRSIEDVGRRRPRLVRPALTSRELAAAPALPPPARSLFARIAASVERSLFGGRPVDAGEWSEARAAYADLVLPRTWRA